MKQSTELIDALKRYHILDADQLRRLSADIENTPLDARGLAQRLIQTGDLTPYQANQLLQGRGNELLLGSYVLIQRLGEGGMGAVFKARNWKLGKIIAVKIIRKDRIDNPETIRRFEREIRAAAQLEHPNIVRALDADEVDGTHLLVMEFAPGDDLAKIVKENGPLPIKIACEYIRQAALGLQHAHERGMVHRDIKPNNLLVTNTSRDRQGAGNAVVKILDMGLARIARRDGDTEASSTMTQEGMVMGTLDYIAPEQAADAHSADIRADIYSLGCTFYVLLTGRVPFPGGDVLSKLMRHKTEEPRSICELRPDVPSGVLFIVNQMMAKLPEQRFETPGELAETLEQLLENIDNVETVPQKPTPLAAKRPRDVSDDTFEARQMWEDAVVANAAVVAKPPAPKPKSEPISRPRLSIAVGGLLGLVALAVILLLVFSKLPSAPPENGEGKDDGRTQSAGKLPKSITNSIGMKLVLIPAGKFTMGSPATESDRDKDEGPQHEVHITKPFYMGVHEVTQAQYQQVMGVNPSHFSSTGSGKDKVAGTDMSNFPVEMVSWNDAVEFCKKLSNLPAERAAGRVYRLPSEAEWEYTCRGGADTYQVFHFGNSLSSTQANFDGNHPYGGAAKGPAPGRTTTVGSYQPNAFGVYDMHGNVYEWCADWYDAEYYGKSPLRDPLCLTEASDRVLRGGSWLILGRSCRAARRGRITPGSRIHGGGFRVAAVQSAR